MFRWAHGKSVAERIIETAIDAGVNFIDTADVYSAGLSERAAGAAVRRHQSAAPVYAATNLVGIYYHRQPLGKACISK